MTRSKDKLLAEFDPTDNVVYRRDRSDPRLNAAIEEAYQVGVQSLSSRGVEVIVRSAPKKICYARAAVLADTLDAAKRDASSPLLDHVDGDRSAITAYEANLIVLAEAVDALIVAIGQEAFDRLIATLKRASEDGVANGTVLCLLAREIAPASMKKPKAWEQQDGHLIADEDDEDNDLLPPEEEHLRGRGRR